MTHEDIYFSTGFAQWIMDNAANYGYIVCNGDSMIDAMDSLIDIYMAENNIEAEEN